MKTYDYKVINASHYTNLEDAANTWANRGWRVIGVIPAKGSGYAHQLILERLSGVIHPDD